MFVSFFFYCWAQITFCHNSSVHPFPTRPKIFNNCFRAIYCDDCFFIICQLRTIREIGELWFYFDKKKKISSRLAIKKKNWFKSENKKRVWFGIVDMNRLVSSDILSSIRWPLIFIDNTNLKCVSYSRWHILMWVCTQCMDIRLSYLLLWFYCLSILKQYNLIWHKSVIYLKYFIRQTLHWLFF